MAQPLTVSIPHKLGKEEAARRLQVGFSTAREKFGQHFTMLEETWTGEHLDFRVAVMGQQASGTVDVAEDAVHLAVELPFFLQMIAQKAKDMIQKQGRILLEKK